MQLTLVYVARGKVHKMLREELERLKGPEGPS
jgi:hypothetical protein